MEERCAKQLERRGVAYEYEQRSLVIPYEVPASNHKYLPDFVITKRDGSLMYLEPKGIWDYNDRYKHLLIRHQHPTLDIRFIFQRATQRIRKGSKTTYADICNGSGRAKFKDIKWKYGDKGVIPEDWFNE